MNGAVVPGFIGLAGLAVLAAGGVRPGPRRLALAALAAVALGWGGLARTVIGAFAADPGLLTGLTVHYPLQWLLFGWTLRSLERGRGAAGVLLWPLAAAWLALTAWQEGAAAVLGARVLAGAGEPLRWGLFALLGSTAFLGGLAAVVRAGGTGAAAGQCPWPWAYPVWFTLLLGAVLAAEAPGAALAARTWAGLVVCALWGLATLLVRAALGRADRRRALRDLLAAWLVPGGLLAVAAPWVLAVA